MSTKPKSWFSAAMIRKTEPTNYQFEVDEPGGDIVPIPRTIDDQLATLRRLINMRVDFEAEEDRIAREKSTLNEEIRKHQTALIERMAEVGIKGTIPGAEE